MHMLKHLGASLWLLVLTVVLCSVLYPLALVLIGQTFFRHQAQGSLLDDRGNLVTDPARARGSRLIGQPFKGDEYFQPRPSNAGNSGYDASASGASNWGASNPLLRSRVARQLGPIVKYRSDSPTKPGKPVRDDVEAWFKMTVKDNPELVRDWALEHPALAEQWVKENTEAVQQWVKDNADGFALALGRSEEEIRNNLDWSARFFFILFVQRYPGSWPTVEEQTLVDPETRKSKTIKGIKPVEDGPDVQAYCFELWLQANKDPIQKGTILLEQVPADMVMSSGSGLDPHLTLKSARYQLKNRVAEKQAQRLLETDLTVARLLEEAKKETDASKRKQIEEKIDVAKAQVRKQLEDRLGKTLEQRVTEEIEKLLLEKREAPLGGLVGVDLVNVLELNLAMDARMRMLNHE
jgi:K+-transporting ATPase ATPase C chain